jgi:hypothetical protein
MTRAPLPRQARGRWAWLAAAVAAAALLAVRRGVHGRSQVDGTAVGTESAEAMAPGATAVRTRLRQACTTASSRISAAGGAVRQLFHNGNGTPSETEAAETAPAASNPAAAPDHGEVPPGRR